MSGATKMSQIATGTPEHQRLAALCKALRDILIPMTVGSDCPIAGTLHMAIAAPTVAGGLIGELVALAAIPASTLEELADAARANFLTGAMAGREGMKQALLTELGELAETIN